MRPSTPLLIISYQRMMEFSVLSYALVAAPMGHAAEHTVCAKGCNYNAIQAAVDAARPGDTIRIFKGTFTENVRIAGTKKLTLTGAGADRTTIDGAGMGSVITIGEEPYAEGQPIDISGITITHGRGQGEFSGGGINAVTGLVTLSSSTIIHNSSEGEGGGLFVLNSELQSVTLKNCTVINNRAKGLGGGIFADEGTHVILTNSTVINNKANWGGGIYASTVALVALNASTVVNNQAAQGGGGLFVSGPPNGHLEVTGSTLINNKAQGDGGGIFNDGTTSLSHSIVVNNDAKGNGGGIFSTSTLFVDSTLFKNNQPNDCAGSCP